MPFPTSLLGEYILTDHTSPAVVLYDLTMAFQAIGWILICNSALNNRLAKNEQSILGLRNNRRFGYFAFVLYSPCAVIALWLPLTIAILTTISWIFWLVYGISIKHEVLDEII